MRFQYFVDDHGIISNVNHIPYPFRTMGFEREIYFEGWVKEIKIADDKKSFTVLTERTNHAKTR